MKILELFAGSCSFSKVAKELNHETFTSDINEMPNIDYVVDIMNFDIEKVPFIPDICWASPDCSTWSKAAGNLHFDSKSLVAKTDKAKKAFQILEKTLEIIEFFKRINKNLKYYIENPVGRMSKVIQAGTLFQKVPRIVTLDQCQYGREYKKPTHIFTNDLIFVPKKRCQGNKSCHHKENLKNSGSGHKNNNTYYNSYYKRAMLPELLCKEILSQQQFLIPIS